MDDVLLALAEAAQDHVPPAYAPLVEALISDFLACCLGSGAEADGGMMRADGTAGTVALLSLRASRRDLDDISWDLGVHVGAVVLPVVIALGTEVGATNEILGRAVAAGYRSAMTMAAALGPDHSRRWHTTATAGTFGAASAASVLLGYSTVLHRDSLVHAAAATGGTGQAVAEGKGAAAFNRAAAATSGLFAARAARLGLPRIVRPLDGDRGLFGLMASVRPPAMTDLTYGLPNVSLRILPVNGHSQSVAIAAACLRHDRNAEFQLMEVQLPNSAVGATDGRAGPWWDSRLAALRAWSAGDAFVVATASELDHLVDRVNVVAGPLGPGQSIVTVTSNGAIVSSATTDPPGLRPLSTESRRLIHQKWTRVLGQDPSRVLALATEVCEVGPSLSIIDELIQ